MKNLPLPLLLIFFLVLSCTSDKKDEQPQANTDSIPAADTNPPVQHNHNYGANVYATVDVSPMDMSYFPVEYYKMNMAQQMTTPLVVRVIYSRPHLNGRKLFSGILKYGEPWRFGANESTEIQFFRDVTVQGKKVKAGRYILYCIPNENTWTIALNTNVDTWGLHPDTSKDLCRFDAEVSKVDHHTEYFTIIFEKTDKGANMIAAWDNYEIKLPIEFSI